MQIEAGKFYRTRDGRKARIYAVDGEIHGAILSCGKWGEDGSFSPLFEHSADLISEWIDKPEGNWPAMPAWANWQAMDKDGEWWWYADEKPEIRRDRGEWYGPHSDRIPFAYAPKWKGNWRASLIERPKR